LLSEWRFHVLRGLENASALQPAWRSLFVEVSSCFIATHMKLLHFSIRICSCTRCKLALMAFLRSKWLQQQHCLVGALLWPFMLLMTSLILRFISSALVFYELCRA
jgi:hypothetical protein